jgi:hypothetical protein
MKGILTTTLMLARLSSFAMETSAPATFPVLVSLTQGNETQEKNVEISLNKETSVVFDSFKRPDPATIKLVYTVKLLALKHSKLTFMNQAKETVNIKGTIERNAQYSAPGSNGTLSRWQKDCTINERKDIESLMMGMHGKFVLGVTVGPQSTTPQSKL